MVSYILTNSEIQLAAAVGLQRALDVIFRARGGRYGEEGVGFERHIMACMGEAAVARHFNIYWNGAFGNLDAADVGPKCQVRATYYSNGHLRLHPDDKPEQPFVLATVNLPTVRLVGWLYGREGQLQEYWKEPQPGRPCFWIPQGVLHSIAELEL